MMLFVRANMKLAYHGCSLYALLWMPFLVYFFSSLVAVQLSVVALLGVISAVIRYQKQQPISRLCVEVNRAAPQSLSATPEDTNSAPQSPLPQTPATDCTPQPPRVKLHPANPSSPQGSGGRRHPALPSLPKAAPAMIHHTVPRVSPVGSDASANRRVTETQ